MRKLFNKLSGYFGNGRYIKIDGSSYHSTSLNQYLQRPEIKAGTLMAITTVGVAMVQNGTYDITHEKILAQILKNLIVDIPMGLGVTLYFARNDKNMPSFNKAIDTKGNDLSQSQISLADYFTLKSKVWAAPLYAGTFLFAGALLTKILGSEQPLPVDSYDIILSTWGATHGLRAKKLLDGDYVFVNKPPQKEEKVKKPVSVFDGQTSPSI